MPQINLPKIIARLKEKPDKKFPFRFELILRRELAEKLETLDGKDAVEKIRESIRFLNIKIDSPWAYEFDITRTYLKYFQSLLPQQKFNWEFDLPDYYYAVARCDGHWIYYQIWPEKRQIRRVMIDYDNMSTSFVRHSLKM
jgi:hypothetical protein